MLVDSHCHLDRLDLSKYEHGLDDAISAAEGRGISHMLCVCISAENKDEVVNIANNYTNLFASVGIHPSDVKDSLVSQEELTAWSKEEKVVAIGETGLDYYYTEDYKDIQQESFKQHLVVAGQEKLPVIVHTRDAREDTIRLIREHGNTHSAGVLHCFTESWEMAQQAMELNYYISISGIVTFKNAESLREVAKKVPIDRLLVETDSPYLAPIPYRGKPNEPKYVREVAEFIAKLRDIDYQELCEHTTNNFFNLFSKANR